MNVSVELFQTTIDRLLGRSDILIEIHSLIYIFISLFSCRFETVFDSSLLNFVLSFGNVSTHMASTRFRLGCDESMSEEMTT